MNPVEKALWFIESHFAKEITLDDIALVGGVSRYHMSRAFGAATGRSVMRYVRGRRLTEAARSLANGAPDILSVALDAGYSSHEAFTRAFRDQFGLAPELVRDQRHIDNLSLVEPFDMDKSAFVKLETPRFEDGRALLVAGLSEHFNAETFRGIPALWQRFVPHINSIPGQVGDIGYGVCYNSDHAGNFDYMAGVEVSDFSGLPDEFSRVHIRPQRYAVFAHRDHISTLPATVHTIWSQWLPESEHEVAEAPNFERYGEEFDGRTGTGGLEIWIPIKT